ncbi:MAG: hypothetical protein ACMG6E_00500 [Candidatus Roizmanbacteria bacterium]
MSDFASPAAKTASKTPTTNIKLKKKTNNNTDPIYVDFERKVDVDKIHQHILNLFDLTVDRLEELEKELAELLEVECKDKIDKFLLDQQIRTVRNEMDSLVQKANHQLTYPDKAMALISQYKSLISKTTTSVIGEDQSIEVDDWDTFQVVAARFIDIARCFTNRIVVKQQVIVAECGRCLNTPVMIDGNAYCPNCKKTIKLKDTETSDNNSGMGYTQDHSCTETVEEAMQHLQGIVKKPIPAGVYQAIEAHCAKYDIDVKKMTKPEIQSILRLLRLSDYYKSFNLIAHVLTGVPLPNVRQYHKAVVERCKLIEIEYALIKKEEGRSNFMFGWYVLRACLVMEGYKANRNDFMTLVTRDAEIIHDHLMKRVCNQIRAKLSEEELKKTNWKFDGLA